MRSKILLGIICALLFGFFLIAPIQPVTSIQSAIPSAQGSSGLSMRLKIPKINVNTTVESVGLTSQGAIDTPEGPIDAAWYNLGPRPGENGTAVIDGHFGWKDGIPAVFDNLYKLQKGDVIEIQNESGGTTTFIVRKVRTYAQNENASVLYGPNDGKAHLALITCEGTWNETGKSYSNRLVVFADKEIK